MSRFILFIPFFALSITLIAQSPKLVVDFNDGSDDGFNRFNTSAITLENSLILPVLDSEYGEEPAIIVNGEVTVLKDINEGSGSSSPRFFRNFNELIYFSAFDPVNGGAVWATDGTEEGTVMKFAHHTGNDWEYPKHFIESKSGFLYYTVGEKLYRTDGENFEFMYDDIDFVNEFSPASPNYCLYEDEIAFVTQVSDYVKLYIVENDSVKILDSIYVFANKPVYGLNKVEGGLIFNVLFNGTDTDVEGTYIYRNETSKIEKITFNGKYASRINPFSEEYALIWVRGDGYYLTNGIAGQEIKMHSSGNNSSNQSESIFNGVYGDNIIFVARAGGFPSNEPDRVIHYNYESGDKKVVLESRSVLSNIFNYGKHSFMVMGSFDPTLYYFNIEAGSYRELHLFDDYNNLKIVGFADNKLYFLSNHNADVGFELYSIDLDFLVSVDNFTKYSVLDVKISMGSHRIISESNAPVEYNIHNISGQLVESGIRTPNTEYDHSYLNGIHIFTFRQGEKKVVKKVYIP